MFLEIKTLYYTLKEQEINIHAEDSVTVAKKLVSDMPEKTEDIIERHMWPAGKSKAPNSIEGVVVSVADKYNSVKDLVMGSDIKHTGVRHYMRKKRDRFRRKHENPDGQVVHFLRSSITFPISPSMQTDLSLISFGHAASP